MSARRSTSRHSGRWQSTLQFLSELSSSSKHPPLSPRGIHDTKAYGCSLSLAHRTIVLASYRTATPVITRCVRLARLSRSTRLSTSTRLKRALYPTLDLQKSITHSTSSLTTTSHDTATTDLRHQNVRIRTTRLQAKADSAPHPSTWLRRPNALLYTRDCGSRHPDTTTLRNHLLCLRRPDRQSYDKPPWQRSSSSGNIGGCATPNAPPRQTEDLLDRRNMHQRGRCPRARSSGWDDVWNLFSNISQLHLSWTGRLQYAQGYRVD